MGETYVGTYRGCDIYYLTPPDVASPVYHSPCITGHFSKRSAVEKRICQGQGWEWVDGVCVSPGPPPPPTVEEPHVAETYRGIDIWYNPKTDRYTATVAPGVLTSRASRAAIREWIDDQLGFLEPPEEPPSGTLAQIVAAVKTWVQSNMPGWVLQWGQNLYTTVNNIVENITNVYNDLKEYVTNVYNNVYKTIENTYNTFKEYITNVYNNTYEYLTQNITNITENITNIVGSSVEWVEERLADNREWTRNFFKLMDPTGFLKDPLGTVSAAFAIWRLAADHVVVESFLAGFEEGLEE